MKRFGLMSLALLLLAGCTVFGRETPDQYIVFFPNHSTELSADARAVVDHAAAAIRGTHPDSVMIAAGTATGENATLAQPRFLAIRQALVDKGVSDDLIARSQLIDVNMDAGATGDQRAEIRLVARTTP